MQRADGTSSAHTRLGLMCATHAAAGHTRSDAFSLHASRVFHPRQLDFSFVVVVVVDRRRRCRRVVVVAAAPRRYSGIEDRERAKNRERENESAWGKKVKENKGVREKEREVSVAELERAQGELEPGASRRSAEQAVLPIGWHCVQRRGARPSSALIVFPRRVSSRLGGARRFPSLFVPAGMLRRAVPLRTARLRAVSFLAIRDFEYARKRTLRTRWKAESSRTSRRGGEILTWNPMTFVNHCQLLNRYDMNILWKRTTVF